MKYVTGDLLLEVHSDRFSAAAAPEGAHEIEIDSVLHLKVKVKVGEVSLGSLCPSMDNPPICIKSCPSLVLPSPCRWVSTPSAAAPDFLEMTFSFSFLQVAPAPN